ncbi:MAG: hypothetical protein ACRDQ7_10005 [Haloechinothrix sp.]
MPSGLYVSVTDRLGKGWAQDLVTHRKSRATLASSLWRKSSRHSEDDKADR